jgi:hypothetical protein
MAAATAATATGATAATRATAANMTAATATSARGCWPRHRRRMGDRLHTLLATVAKASRLLRILNANERTIRFRLADGRGTLNWTRRGTLNWSGCGTPNWTGRGTGNTLRAFSLLRHRVGQLLSYGRRSCRTRGRIPAITPVASVGRNCAGMIV